MPQLQVDTAPADDASLKSRGSELYHSMNSWIAGLPMRGNRNTVLGALGRHVPECFFAAEALLIRRLIIWPGRGGMSALSDDLRFGAHFAIRHRLHGGILL